MKFVIPIRQGRISPVFDVARQLLLVESTGSREAVREERSIPEDAADERVKTLVELGVDTLICAGISQTLERMLTDAGIRVTAGICGDVEEVLAAFAAGRLDEERFVMPGCCGRRRWRHGGECRRRGPLDR